MEKKKTLMITGASGFIGSNFIKRYEKEYNIVSVCLIKNRPEDLDFTGIDTILHLAALVHQMKGAPEEKYFEINTRLTERLAKKAKEDGVKHFVFYSTVKVYGYDGDLENHDFVLTENSPCNPNDPYGASKYEAEKILKNLENENFKISIIRPPLVYGEGVKGNMLSLIKLVNKCPILPFDYDNNRRTMVGIENLLYMTKLIIDKKANGIYIGSDLKDVSIKNITEAMEKGLNKKRIKIKLPTFIFNFLCKRKKNIMVRLYGTLAFQQEDSYKKINYKIKNSLEKEIHIMTKDYR
ncbi:UDP-glucose 4-epimerase [Cetobacterium ceti]|uniref:UDP-glucose 4-epimerase n=1 Tax=Cetobacterium ceti TaxID=180163 RepID=A0A1T4LS96_9FUSO|nr:NAD-dependent epimerase/dehydratase family protein [Cetobacterium ceti]SJZ57600.1 UDP-glucose 4-epimerase [Cetobacterium ceti]